MNKFKIFFAKPQKKKIIIKSNYIFIWTGYDSAPEKYLSRNTLDNTFFKEKFYSELVFYYFYSKNELKNIEFIKKKDKNRRLIE